MKEVLLITFGWMSIACAAGVVFFRNPIYSAFCLILCFFGLSGIYVVWGAPFIAMVQILIYTGAIVVLFVFVIMLLDMGKGNVASRPGWISVWVTALSVWFFALLLLRTLNTTNLGANTAPLVVPADIRTISKLLYTEYLWPFEVLSVFLLALIIAIFALTRSQKVEGI